MLQLLAHNAAVCVGFVAVLLAMLAVLFTVESRVTAVLFRRVGWRASLIPTAIIGVPLHELSHLLAAKLFGHRIVGYSLFEPDPSTGTLGYVRHAYRRRNPWQLMGTFFIGVAPFFAGALTLGIVTLSLFPADALPELYREAQALRDIGLTRPESVSAHISGLASLVATATREVRVTPWLGVQLYVAIAVASHMAPSPRDLTGGLLGGLVFALLLTGVVTAATATRVPLVPFAAVLVPVAIFGLFAVTLQTAYVAVVWFATRPLSSMRRSRCN